MIIGEKDQVHFVLHETFENRLLRPVGEYVNWKLVNGWDDYNELFHCSKFIEELKNRAAVWWHTHTIEKDNIVTGVLLIVGGEIDVSLGHSSKEETVLLKYFHVQDKGKGLGSYWLQSVIMPYYRIQRYREILVSSSHPRSFNFYSKLGVEVDSNTKRSDNDLYDRDVKTFSIPITE